MVETTFNMFDAAVLGIVVLSALLSFFRGFIREVLSLGAWLGASLVTTYYFLDVAALINPQVKNPAIASGIAAMGLFIFALLVFAIVNAILMKLFKQGKDVGMLDNMLGLGFGVLRACLLISLSYFIFSFFKPEKEYPQWLAEAKTRPYVESGAEIIAKIAPSYLEKLSPKSMEDGSNPLDSLLPRDNAMEPSAGAPAKPGSGWMNIEELEKLVKDKQEEKQ